MPKNPDLRKILAVPETVLLMDGAMGTELCRLGLALEAGEFTTDWVRSRPDDVTAIHRAYAEAGACVLLTNTFPILEMIAQGRLPHEDVRAICRESVALARSVSPDIWVLGSIGPLFSGKQPKDDVFAELLHGFEFADGLILETFSETWAVELAAELVRSTNLPIFLSMTYGRGDRDVDPVRVARSVAQIGLAGLGVNCGRDITPARCAEIVRDYARGTDVPIFARPNAGSPEGYLPPARFAREMSEVLKAGVRLVGGCCGTTPAHIEALNRVTLSERR